MLQLNLHFWSAPSWPPIRRPPSARTPIKRSATTCSSNVPAHASHRRSSHSARASLALRSRGSKTAPATSASGHSIGSQPQSAFPSRASLSRVGSTPDRWTTTSSSVASTNPIPSSSTPTISLLPSPMPNGTGCGTATPEGPPWRVPWARKPEKVARRYGLHSAIFRPTLGQLVRLLEIEPKRFPKKRGRLRDARAAELLFADGIAWRAVFTVSESTRTVRILAVGPHDRAYEEAERRGGQVMIAGHPRGAVLSAQANVTFWATNAHCATPPHLTAPASATLRVQGAHGVSSVGHEGAAGLGAGA